MVWRRRKKRHSVHELNPDEILLDVHNLPQFDMQQFEGRMERPIAKQALRVMLASMVCIALFFIGRLGYLQIVQAAHYKTKSEQNSLDHIALFADRGVIYDRSGVELGWNAVGATPDAMTVRQYISSGGFASLLGYVSYPAHDNNGKLWQTRITGKDGIEEQFDTLLAGKNGTKIIETNVSGEITSESTIVDPERGENLSLSIDARVQEALYEGIRALAEKSGYNGGAGAVMDIATGELYAMTSFPQYDQSILSLGADTATINEYVHGSGKVFLNRMTEALYTPGSIVKPFLALAALQEGVIDSNKVLHTTGELRIPNPYNPGQFTIFRDNADHGDVDMRKAIAVSSNVYFYQIVGGFGTQKGLGITNIEKYAKLFGIGEKTGSNFGRELSGVVPSVAWKKKTFPSDSLWRIGDTYNTSIGQYGFQVTPMSMLRAVSGIASRGTLVTPTILKNLDGTVISKKTLPFSDMQYDVIFDAMKMTVTEGSAGAFINSEMSVAAKTGTAQIKSNTRVNSSAIGFFPADNPRFAFTVIMEDGPKVSSGATHAMKPVIELFASTPELLGQAD